MRDRLSAWFPIGLLVLLAALTFWLDRTVQPAPPKRDGSTRHDPDYYVENFAAVRTGPDGAPRYRLAAAKMTHYPDDDSTVLAKPNFVSFEASAAPVQISAEKGLVSKDGEHAYFSGNVHVQREAYANKSRMTLDTEFLHIITEQEKALTDKPVTLRDANTTVTAVGLELDNRARVAKLLSRVKARYDNPH